MLFIKNKSIQQKMMLITLTICSVVLLVATGLLFTYQLFAFHQSFIREMSILADIISENSAAPVMFNDKVAAKEVLAALRAKPLVTAAWIQLPDGTEFTSFGLPSGGGATLGPAEHEANRFVGRNYLQAERIMHGSDDLGTLYVLSDYQKGYLGLLALYLGILGFVLAVSITLAFLLSARLHRHISGPILSLADTAREVARRNDYAIRAVRTADGELGLLTDTFNQMLVRIESQDTNLQQAQRDLAEQIKALQSEITERKRAEAKLAELHQKLLEVSRKAGMAEVATSVLHNVGNVLNSLNVSVNLTQDRLRKARMDNLAKIVAMVESHTEDLGAFLTTHPQGRMVPKYLHQLAAHLAQCHTEVVEETENIAKNVEHIKEIVAMQQAYARVGGVFETLPASAVVEDAVQMNASALDRHGVELQRDYADVPAVIIDRHKALQILVNLIQNARHALKESDRPNKVLRLAIDRGSANCVAIRVSDNGVGILPENLTRIFSHGFTTKKDGHGFGLHSAALAAKEMGGTLTAHSAGLGQGATFTLELPIRHNEDIP
jgi:two-component system, NtrC family, sensor kinase